eukprot:TRINITY_DN22591_c0_g1_i1.p1 TRINITY_DN22591_c0_g1~~TRINITY_DN22591_c0_g1_i1.p1  ORF type:complete len:801 (-),score=149.15 TRINITY_DN22591_c0_g1_i1:36-2408(-)
MAAAAAIPVDALRPGLRSVPLAPLSARTTRDSERSELGQLNPQPVVPWGPPVWARPSHLPSQHAVEIRRGQEDYGHDLEEQARRFAKARDCWMQERSKMCTDFSKNEEAHRIEITRYAHMLDQTKPSAKLETEVSEARRELGAVRDKNSRLELSYARKEKMYESAEAACHRLREDELNAEMLAREEASAVIRVRKDARSAEEFLEDSIVRMERGAECTAREREENELAAASRITNLESRLETAERMQKAFATSERTLAKELKRACRHAEMAEHRSQLEWREAEVEQQVARDLKNKEEMQKRLLYDEATMMKNAKIAESAACAELAELRAGHETLAQLHEARHLHRLAVVQHETYKKKIRSGYLAEYHREAEELRVQLDNREEKFLEDQAPEKMRLLREAEELRMEKDRLVAERKKLVEEAGVALDVGVQYANQLANNDCDILSNQDLQRLFLSLHQACAYLRLCRSADNFDIRAFLDVRMHILLDILWRMVNLFRKVDLCLQVLEVVSHFHVIVFEQLEVEATPRCKSRLYVIWEALRERIECAEPVLPSSEQHFGQILRRATAGAEIQMLLDQSSSISEHVFETELKPSALAIIEEFSGLIETGKDNMPISWGAVAYGPLQVVGGDDAYPVGTLSFKQMIRDHPYGDGGTPTAEALEKALWRFQTSYSRMIFNFTDGEPGDLEAATRILKTCSEQGVVVVGLGVGSGVDMEQLKEFSSDGFAYLCKDFGEVRDLLAAASLAMAEADKAIEHISFQDMLKKITLLGQSGTERNVGLGPVDASTPMIQLDN